MENLFGSPLRSHGGISIAANLLSGKGQATSFGRWITKERARPRPETWMPRVTIAPVISESVFDSELKLKYSRQIVLRADLAKGCIVDVVVIGGHGEANIVEDVERINPEHKP
jgi:hypothetical protein